LLKFERKLPSTDELKVFFVVVANRYRTLRCEAYYSSSIQTQFCLVGFRKFLVALDRIFVFNSAIQALLWQLATAFPL